MESFPSLKRLFFVTLITALAGTGALAVLALLSGDLSEGNWRVIATSGLVALASLMAMPAGILIERALAPFVAWATLALVGAAFFYAMALVWDITETFEPLVGLAAVAAAASQTAALTALTKGTGGGFLYIAATALAFFAAILLGWMVLEGEYELWHVLGAVVVADVVCALIQPLVGRLRTLPAAAASNGYRVVFAVDSEPGLDELEAARDALASLGARLERIERPA
jgi:hypothetical protein